MKNFTLALNIVLVIAVGILFYWHFSNQSSSATIEKQVPTGNFSIAYFEPDSLQNQFEYYKDVRNALDSKQQEYGKQLNQYKRNIAEKYQSLQAKAQSMSQAEIANKQQELVDLDKEAKNKEQAYSQELQDETFKKLQEIKKEIEDFLKEYNKDKRYAYIFSGTPDLMYYKDTAYNITADLVKGLNELHKKKK